MIDTQEHNTAPEYKELWFDKFLFSLARNLLWKVIIAAILFLCVFIGISFFYEINQTIQVSGTIISKNYTIVSTQSNGRMIGILFHDGQFVNKGDLLAVLDTLEISHQINLQKNQILMDDQEYKIASQKVLDDSVANDNQIEINKIELQNLSYDYKLAMVRFLEADQLSKLNSDSGRDVNIKGIENNLLLKEKQNEIDIKKLVMKDLYQKRQQIFEEKQSLYSKLLDLENKKIQLIINEEEKKNKFIYAREEGFIVCDNINNFIDHYFTASEKIGEIHRRDWVIEAVISEDNLADIKIGQKVDIRLLAFPYADYGSFDGILSSISEYPLINGLTGKEGKVFKADIAIVDSSISKIDLLKGCTVSANIITDNDSIINLLKKKLLKYSSKVLN